MITKESNEHEWMQLKALWDRNGGEYVQKGGVTFRVFTPNGEDLPQFLPQNVGMDAYSKTSTGVVRGAEPKRPISRSAPSPGSPPIQISDVE